MIRRLSIQYVRVGSVVTRCISSTAKVDINKEKESWNTEPEKDDVPKGEWQSFFNYFAPKQGITVDMVHHLQKGIDLRPKALEKWLKKRKQKKVEADQSYQPERVATLGFDLAAAHFIVHRGGKIRFKGSQEWTEQDKDGEYELPSHYDNTLAVEAIDASGMNLIYEGIECLSNLKSLTWLSLANCSHIDDWCIDRICGQYSSTLEYLDISQCTNITHHGIAALARLKKLKSLQINGLDNIKDIKLLCILLEDVLPEIKITGVHYLDPAHL